MSFLPLIQIETATAFIQAYEARYGNKPGTSGLVAYEATSVLLQAIARADVPTRQGVLRAMHQLDTLSGALGTWAFDANGDTSSETIDLLQLQDGKWIWIETIR